MKDKNLERLKKEYMDIPIPKELDYVVRKAIKESSVNMKKRKNKFKRTVTIAASIAATIGVLTVGINTSSVFADNLSKVPIVGEMVKVLTFKEYTVDEEKFNADIKVPRIQGLGNQELENSLNEKYIEENKKLYDQFIAEMEELKEKGGGNIGVDAGYEIITDNDLVFSIKRYVVKTAGSSYTELKYDTIDKKKQVLITLPSLFKDDSYIEVISKNIISQMRTQMEDHEDKTYWIADDTDEEPMEGFEKISKKQNFYINEDGKLVVVFDKYEVAAGYMGNPEFVIPTDVIKDILAGSEYIK